MSELCYLLWQFWSVLDTLTNNAKKISPKVWSKLLLPLFSFFYRAYICFGAKLSPPHTAHTHKQSHDPQINTYTCGQTGNQAGSF